MINRVYVSNMLALVGFVFCFANTASIAMAQEQASYWTLTFYIHAKFGWSSVSVYAYGPFGAQKGGWFDTGVGAYATIDLPSSDFPSGYTYKISIMGPGITDLPSTFVATSNGQDQTYTYEYNPYGSDSLTG
jgi:hypothetical protein